MTLGYADIVKLRSASLSDYNNDGISDIVMTDKELNTMYIVDGRRRMLLDSLNINVGRSLCDNENIESIHAAFINIDPSKSNKTAVLSRRVSRNLQGTRSDNRVVMAGGSTMLSYPCDYELKGFIDREGDGYYTIMLENLTAGTLEIWALP